MRITSRMRAMRCRAALPRRVVTLPPDRSLSASAAPAIAPILVTASSPPSPGTKVIRARTFGLAASRRLSSKRTP